MEYTSNYHLSKPESDDIINPTSRTGYNGNFDTLDSTLKSVSNKANANESNITDLQGDIADINAKTGDDIPFESGSADSVSDKIAILYQNVGSLSDLLTTAKNSIVAAINEIVGKLGIDWIVEEGTSGIWTYRKWNSGIAECWGSKQWNSVPFDFTWGSMYLTSTTETEAYTINYPTNLFITTPICHLFYQRSNNVGGWIGEGSYPGNASHTPSFAIIRPTTSPSVIPNVLYHAKGRWK